MSMQGVGIESACYLPEGGEWEIFRNSSNPDEFDEPQIEEIETTKDLNHHRIITHT
jgi:hypothetical protein